MALIVLSGSKSFAQAFVSSQMDELLYGVAYYYEYMPSDRLEQDARMMKACGINVVRIAESTWAYQEPQDGAFNMDYHTKVMDVMHENGIKVIVGTPTYAIPSWLDKKHPDILLTDKSGKRPYGARQIMDITNPNFRFYAERIIRELMASTAKHPAVIGFQVDNETKHYDAEGPHVQALFVEHLKRKFETPEAMNTAYGLEYWSNSVYNWEHMPSTIGTVNGSIRNEFEKFRRELVTEYLAWQVDIVNEYKQDHQFVTQNFDMEWRGSSYSIQSRVDHFEAAVTMDIAGIDIYHATADNLDGVVIGMGGDLARSMKQDNYLVMETQAQSILGPADQELLYPGQLRLQAYSHLANGANGILYWPWNSIHNSTETYWKGLLSHDMESNPTYLEAKQIGEELKSHGQKLINLKKDNDVAIYFSNESLTALELFPFSYDLGYNDIVRSWYEILFKLNVECDFVDHTIEDLSKYKLLVVPPLYTASGDEIDRLLKYVENGGHILFGFKSGFTNEDLQVHQDRQPAALREACGFSYQQFTKIDKLRLKENPFNVDSVDNYVSTWAELLTAESASVIGAYEHPYWGKYAAITENEYGKGKATYVGSMPSEVIMKELLRRVVAEANVSFPEQNFPIIIRSGVNMGNDSLHYVFNYSQQEHAFTNPYPQCVNVITKETVEPLEVVKLRPWDFVILEQL